MSLEAVIKYPVVFLTALVATLVLTSAWMRLAPRWGFMDPPGGRRIHSSPVPRGGGIAVFAGFHLACAVVFLLPWSRFSGQLSLGWWLKFLPLSAGVVGLGLLDDRINLKPIVKLLGQVILALAAYAADIRLQNLLGRSMPVWVDVLATVFWFVALMNAFNLIDGLDGLATGIALIASVGIGLSLVFRGAPGDVLLFLGFAGACLGFLRYNFHPAGVFLGDAGSLFLGFTLAALSISTHSKASFMAGIGVPLLAAGVPLFDSLLAVWRRSMRLLLRGPAQAAEPRPGFSVADSDHLHHRLLRMGLEPGRVAVYLYAATFLLVAVGLLASLFRDRALGILVLAFLLAAYTVMRHLADIELRASGQVVLQGLTRPVRRNRTLIIYLAGDVILLNLALLAALTLMDRMAGTGEGSLKAAWLQSAPLDVVLPFVFLLLFRSYSRVWYLARVSEYAGTGVAVTLGCAAAWGLHLVGGGLRASDGLVIHYLLLAGMAAPAVVFTRASVRVVQDLMQWRPRGSPSGGASPVRALVYGAGYRTTLFLRQNTLRESEREPIEVVGLISGDAAITGHTVHGVRVRGTVRDLPALVARLRIACVYLVEEIGEDAIGELRATLAGTGVRLVLWKIVETEISR